MSITNHAARRLHERGLSNDDLAAALAGRAYKQQNGNTLHYDRSSRCAVIFDPQVGEVITAYRLQRKQIKRHYSR